MKKLLVLFILAASISCTENQRAKHWGGTADVDVQPNYKVVNVTWKESDLWILTKPMSPNDVAETYTFYEKSSWGILSGTFIIKEQKTYSTK